MLKSMCRISYRSRWCRQPERTK